ncbi:MAG: hypothetical protein K9W45_04980 [Candidatus Heimdallarchaeum aukensis]|uniref:Uncharacterized protein n=1 Tax=Candidatus Heimdallarchaeum aukensis TaxID=2876573 RepID=A0A9Y1FLM5_9ARCH|nr:MAG: hypothetical protein K9W45_04980 [Candidatus Heimdallarchaeum aukensis]
MKSLSNNVKIDSLVLRMDEDLRKLEKELEKIIKQYPRYMDASVEKLSSALDRYYQAH